MLYFTKKKPSALHENVVEVPMVTWNDIGGLEEREMMDSLAVSIQFQYTNNVFVY